MRNAAHSGNTRIRPAAPFRRVLGVAMSLLMLLASMPMDVVAEEIDRAAMRREAAASARAARTFVSSGIPLAAQGWRAMELARRTALRAARSLADGGDASQEMGDIAALAKTLARIRDAELGAIDGNGGGGEARVRIEAGHAAVQARLERLGRLSGEALRRELEATAAWLGRLARVRSGLPRRDQPRRGGSPGLASSSPTSSSLFTGPLLAATGSAEWMAALAALSATASSGPAVPADFAPSPECQSDDPAIASLAEELGNSPVRIYEFVRNEVAFEPYWGLQKGAARTLAEMAGNGLDQAALLAALLRASGFAARYVLGTAELTGEQAAKWTGVDDGEQALRLLEANGVPCDASRADGGLTIRVAHAWVRALLPYFPYRGAADGGADTWIELDGSFKQHGFTDRGDVAASIGLRPAALLANVRAGSTSAQDGSYVSRVPEQLIISELFECSGPLRGYLAASGLKAENVFRQRRVAESRTGLLPVTDLYPSVCGFVSAAIPDELVGTATLRLLSPDGSESLSCVLPLHRLAGARVTLSYGPASGADAQSLAAHSSEADFPAYLVNLVPSLRVDGVQAASGASVGMGRRQRLEAVFSLPGQDPVTRATTVVAGGFSAFVLDLQRITEGMLAEQASLMEGLSAQDGRDALLGESLRGIALSYFHQMDRFNQVTAGALGVAVTRAPSLVRAAWEPDVSEQFGVPLSATAGTVRLDVLRDVCVPSAVSRSRLEGEGRFAFVSALTGSALEHNVLSQPFSGGAVSAARIIQRANRDGIRVRCATAANVDAVCASLDGIPQGAVDAVRAAVAAGCEATLTETPVTVDGREYCAYLVRDLSDGSSDLVLDSLPGGETPTRLLLAADLVLDAPDGLARALSASSSVPEWLRVAGEATTAAGLAYLPAIVAVDEWLAGAGSPDAAALVASVIAVCGPMTEIYLRPAILDATPGDTPFSPNGDGVRDSFTFSASVTRGASWRFTVSDTLGNVVHDVSGSEPRISVTLDSPLPDGEYAWRATASLDGVEASPVEGRLVVDCTPPRVSVDAPQPGFAVTNGRPLAIRGTVDDQRLASATLAVQGEGQDGPETLWTGSGSVAGALLATVDSTQYPNGQFLVTLSAIDRAGNSSVSAVSCTIDNPVPDTAAPQVALSAVNPADGSSVAEGALVDAAAGRIDVSASATDDTGVARLALLLDGDEVASSADGALSFTLHTAGLADGGHVLRAVAGDAAGNTASSDLSFTLSSPVSGLRVTPALAGPGTSSVSVSASLRTPSQWTLAFSGPGSIPSVSGEGASVYAAFDPSPYPDGDYTATLSTADGHAASAQFTLDLVLAPPVAAIRGLDADPDGAPALVEEGILNVSGTADDPDAGDTVSWRLEVAPRDGTPVVVTPAPRGADGFRAGRVPEGSSFGEIDLTTLRNGVYTLRLTVRSSGNPRGDAVAERAFVLESGLKVGEMGFSQQDLVIPACGQPISVIRTYSSLAANTPGGDFGPGWTFSIKDMEVEISEERGIAYDEYGDPFDVRWGGGRDVTLTMPDGTRRTFRYGIESAGGMFQTYRAVWKAAPGCHATLRPTCSDSIVALPGGMQYWQAAGPETPFDEFDIPGFVLTTADGVEYRLEREPLGGHFQLDDYSYGTTYVETYGEARLASITAPGGSSLVFTGTGIESYDATGARTSSVVFRRDAANRITAIYARDGVSPDGSVADGALPQMKYEYDAAGNLSRALRLLDRTKPEGEQYAATEYIYGDPARPHFVTAVRDALGNEPMCCEYDSDGRLVATIDAYGNRVEMAHDLSGRAETVTDRMGNPTTHLYDERGNVTATIDALGNSVSYAYDAAGNRTSETDALGNVTRHSYDASGHCTSTTDPLGNTTFFEYDAHGNRTRVTDALGNSTVSAYDAAGNLLSTTDALGNTTSSSYDASGRLTSSTDAAGRVVMSMAYSGTNSYPATVTDASGVVRSLSYDSADNPVATSYVWTDGTVTRTVSTQSTYDDDGNLLSATDPEGNVTSTVYDANGKRIRAIDPEGNVTEYEYDLMGNVIETRSPDGTVSRTVYDANGRAVIAENPHLPGEPATGVRHVFDAAGREVRTETLAGLAVARSGASTSLVSCEVVSSTSTVFDAAGRAVSRTDAAGAATRYEYDACGRTVAVTDALGNTTCYEYDALGRRVAMVDALGRRTEYVHDALGRQVGTVHPDGSSTSVEYDECGRRVSSTDRAGRETRFEYDDAGRLSAVEKPEVENPATGGMVSPRWEFGYDAYGHRVSITDPMGRVTRFTCDYAGRRLSRTLPMGQVETAVYDARGRVTRRTAFDGSVTEFLYDTLGRETARRYTRAGDSTFSEESLTEYDALGRVASKTAPDGGVFSYLYDDFGRVLRRSSPQGSVLHEYDDATGRKVRTTTASGDVFYGYDLLGRLSEVAVARLGGQDFAEPRVTEYGYDEIGVRSYVRRWNGVETEYAYDVLDRLVSLEHRGSNGTSIATFSYSYQADGRRSSAVEDTPTGTSIVRYSYDALGRLLSETRTGGAHPFSAGYAYDLNGNRLSRTVAADGVTEATSYSYDDNDRLLAETTDGAVTSYAYDGNGSLASKVKAGEFAYAFTYNLQGRLAAMQASRLENGRTVSVSAEYAYNPSGIRTSALQTIDGIVSDRHFLLDEGLTGYSQVLEECAAIGGSPVKSYVLGDDVLAQDGLALLKDGHGSTRALVGADGTVAESYDYDAYGRMLGGNPGVAEGRSLTDILYSGEQFDPGLQMEYLRARWYDQDSGRFNRIDPFDGYDEEPQSLHKYAYCHCDPVNGIDPSGNFNIPPSLLKLAGKVGSLSAILILIGIAAHKTIGTDYRNKHWENTVYVNSPFFSMWGQSIIPVPGSSRRPDIYNFDTMEIYEIKSYFSSTIEQAARTANIQLNEYINILGKIAEKVPLLNNIAKEVTPGTWEPEPFYFLNNNVFEYILPTTIYVTLIEPGCIVYTPGPEVYLYLIMVELTKKIPLIQAHNQTRLSYHTNTSISFSLLLGL